MSISLECASVRTFVANRDPDSNDFEVSTAQGTVSMEIGNQWRNSSSGTLWQCIGMDPGTSATFMIKPDFSTGTFTPELQFGGASTGITYTTQQGNYVKVSNAVTFNIYIVLSNKGSANGNARVSGLPFTNGSVPAAITSYFQNCDLSLTYTSFGSRIAPSSNTILLFEHGTLLSIQNLTDALFQNDTAFFISGSIFI